MYANEVGSINFISIEKSTHTYLEFPLLVFYFCEMLILPVCLHLAHSNERKYTLVIMGSSCFAANTDKSLDMDRECQLRNIVLYDATAEGQW